MAINNNDNIIFLSRFKETLYNDICDFKQKLDNFESYKLGNHYNDDVLPFIVKYNKFFIDNSMISKYVQLIENHETIIKDIDRYLKNNCIHEWITDYIDIDCEKTQKIIYCSKCLINKY
jgi:hypothetical protein